MSELIFLKRSQIDTAKWDRAIDSSANAMIYAYSWYLDSQCEGEWGAVIQDDYTAVFPVPIRKKFGIPYVYQPYFCQQLGLFAPYGFTDDQMNFILAIPLKFKKIHLQLNNYFPCSGELVTHPNFILPLNKTYKLIKEHYTQDANKNLKKSTKYNVNYLETADPEMILKLHTQTWGKKDKNLTAKDYERFLRTCNEAKKRNVFWGIVAKLDEEILGSAIFMRSPVYLHYLVSGPTPAGRRMSIMHGIIDHAIQKHADSALIMDFEGSKIPEVAAFYQKWGSTLSGYYEILIRRKLL